MIATYQRITPFRDLKASALSADVISQFEQRCGGKTIFLLVVLPSAESSCSCGSIFRASLTGIVGERRGGNTLIAKEMPTVQNNVKVHSTR